MFSSYCISKSISPIFSGNVFSAYMKKINKVTADCADDFFRNVIYIIGLMA